MLSASYIRSLEGDRECLEALAWLAEHGKGYRPGGFTPPLTSSKPTLEQTRFLALYLRIGRVSRLGAGSRVTRVDWFDGDTISSADGSNAAIAKACSERLFVRAHSGALFVTSGKRRQALDTWLDSQGRELLQLGYTLQPCLSGGSVSWCIVRKGKYKWTVTLFESMTGRPVSDGTALAPIVEPSQPTTNRLLTALYTASLSTSSFYMASFGVALAPTVGMTAMRAARITIEKGFRKWRPAPLLVAMNRQGLGYRGGLTYAVVSRGPTSRIDVTRQYTHALTSELPHEWSFGKFPGFHYTGPGVWMCRVRLGRMIPYPIGVWTGPENGFELRTVSEGEYICVLHAPDIKAIVRSGGYVWPTFGYRATRTWTLASYVQKIQGLLSAYGRDSAHARLSKPLGNYVYGKLGQNPKRDELLFSEEYPGDEWYPYYDQFGQAWDNIWERTVEKYAAAQHIDIAGHLTATARLQTVEMWASLIEAGYRIVRCHTDSLTVSGTIDPSLLSDGTVIGGWRQESQDADTIIVGPNAYSDERGVHIAGVERPTFEMVERMLDGQTASTHQRIRKPRSGWDRGDTMQERTMRATGR